MNRIPAMVDMARSKADKAEVASTINGVPDYPYGLSISLSEVELEKLGLEDDCAVGDMLHLHCMGKVTSVSKHNSEAAGENTRIEIQITHMVGENEEDENTEATPADKRRARLYG